MVSGGVGSPRFEAIQVAQELGRGRVRMASETNGGERLEVGGVELEVVRRGAGRPILMLHGFQTIDPEAHFLELLARHAEVIAPSSPGFGHSPRPKDFDTIYDLVHLYLEVLET